MMEKSISKQELQNILSDQDSIVASDLKNITLDEFDRVKKLDNFYELINDSKKLISENKSVISLNKIDSSKDSIIINNLNSNKNIHSMIEEFNKLGDNVQGSNISKEIAVELIKNIRLNREDEIGKEIYIELREFVKKINIKFMIDNGGEIIFKKDVVINTVLYILIGVDLDIRDLESLSKSIQFIIDSSLSNITTPISIDNQELNNKIEEINNNIRQSDYNANKRIDEISINNQNIVKWILKGSFLLIKSYPLILTGGSVTGLVIIGGLIFKSSLNNEILSSDPLPIVKIHEKDKIPKTIIEAIIRFIYSYSKKDD